MEWLIRMNPHLSCPDCKVKSSKELLLTFPKDYLLSEGNVTKHLAFQGCTVKHKRTKLDEFDFAETTFRVKLRCGLRLVRVAEPLTGAVLAHQMHRPRHLQSPEGAQHRGGPQGSESRQLLGCDHHRGKDLADCHQKKTLQPLWTIILATPSPPFSTPASETRWYTSCGA